MKTHVSAAESAARKLSPTHPVAHIIAYRKFATRCKLSASASMSKQNLLKAAAFDTEPTTTWRRRSIVHARLFEDQAVHVLRTTAKSQRSTWRTQMSMERANDLARHCTELVRQGKDFSTVWSMLLKTHALVEGTARQRLECDRSLLDIPLITGEQLVYDADVREFRVQ